MNDIDFDELDDDLNEQLEDEFDHRYYDAEFNEFWQRAQDDDCDYPEGYYDDIQPATKLQVFIIELRYSWGKFKAESWVILRSQTLDRIRRCDRCGKSVRQCDCVEF